MKVAKITIHRILNPDFSIEDSASLTSTDKSILFYLLITEYFNFSKK